ncbi:MAG TPA: amidohydrolase family protein, partial [Mycobacterium sp.]|nr:amidohydrolase family protein [Mycobacterium sp.]
MLIQHAVTLEGAAVDLRVGASIDEVADTLTPRPGEDVLDAAGGTVLPGLHDHHVHLFSAAAAATSLRVGPPQVRDRDALAGALASAEAGEDGWIRAVGYHDSVAGPLDRDVLDAVAPGVPLRVQHRSGVLWILNSAGLKRVGLAEHPDGRLRSADSWADALGRSVTSLADLSERLSRCGVTGITDATPDLDIADMVRLSELHRHGELRQHVHCLAPGKRILHDDDLDLEQLAGWIADRHRDTHPVAIH